MTPIEWLEDLCKEAGYSEDQTATLRNMIRNNDKALLRFGEVVKKAGDYESQLGRQLAADKAAKDAQALAQQWKEWAEGKEGKPGAVQMYNQIVAERDAALARAGALPNGNGNGGADLSKYLTKEELQNLMAERDARYASVIKTVGRIASRHAAHFGEELDTDQLETIAKEKGVDVATAYEQMVKPRLEAKAKEQAEKEKKEFAEQAVKDALSKYKLPVDPVPTETAPMYMKYDVKDVPKDLDADLLAAWHGVK